MRTFWIVIASREHVLRADGSSSQRIPSPRRGSHFLNASRQFDPPCKAPKVLISRFLLIRLFSKALDVELNPRMDDPNARGQLKQPDKQDTTSSGRMTVKHLDCRPVLSTEPLRIAGNAQTDPGICQDFPSLRPINLLGGKIAHWRLIPADSPTSSRKPFTLASFSSNTTCDLVASHSLGKSVPPSPTGTDHNQRRSIKSRSRQLAPRTQASTPR